MTHHFRFCNYLDKAHRPVRVSDDLKGFKKWARQFKQGNRAVAKTEIEGCTISTVFLGVDHALGLRKKPVLFETMVFGGPLSNAQMRYCTWAEAEAGHALMVERVKKYLANRASISFPE